MVNLLQPGQDPKALVQTLTSYLMHKHYCENDVEALVALFDPEDFFWLGAAEQEYAAGRRQVAEIFRRFAGKVPACNITGEEYQVMELSPGAYLCYGRAWIATDPATQVYIRVHQRITTAFRFWEGRAFCTHIHISNPYSEMVPEDVGFPTQVAQQTYQYLQEQVEKQKQLIADQTAELMRLSFEDLMTGMYNHNRFYRDMESGRFAQASALGVACFDINGLKGVNDRAGHLAGDEFIREAARHIIAAFPGLGYRLGGDEFLVLWEGVEEDVFRQRVKEACAQALAHGVPVASGVSWRAAPCDVRRQVDEADRLMYLDKERYYGRPGYYRKGGE